MLRHRSGSALFLPQPASRANHVRATPPADPTARPAGPWRPAAARAGALRCRRAGERGLLGLCHAPGRHAGAGRQRGLAARRRRADPAARGRGHRRPGGGDPHRVQPAGRAEPSRFRLSPGNRRGALCRHAGGADPPCRTDPGRADHPEPHRAPLRRRRGRGAGNGGHAGGRDAGRRRPGGTGDGRRGRQPAAPVLRPDPGTGADDRPGGDARLHPGSGPAAGRRPGPRDGSARSGGGGDAAWAGPADCRRAAEDGWPQQRRRRGIAGNPGRLPYGGR